jgi:hypothetical protein
MSTQPQLQLSIPSNSRTEDCSGAQFEALAARQRLGEIRMTIVEVPTKKQKFVWRVHYEVLR